MRDNFKMKNITNSLHLKNNFTVSNFDRHMVSFSHNMELYETQKISQIPKGDIRNRKIEPIIIINADILPPLKDIPSYGSVIKSSSNKDSFYNAIGPVVILGQVFGLMPLSGVLGKDASSLKFSWRSWKIIYNVVCLLAGAVTTSFCVARVFSYEISFGTISSLMFYGSTTSISLLFLRLARRWPKICLAIEREESRSAPHVLNDKHTTLVTKFKFLTFLIIFTALVEHILSVLSGLATVYGCDHDNPLSAAYFYSSFSQVFRFTIFAPWKGFFLQLYNTYATFNWIFGDLFIIIMSVYLAIRFEKINSCIRAAKGKNLPEHFWKVIRNEYANLAHLVTFIDDNINALILISFANNLYIICQQLFNTFNTAHDDNATTIPCWKTLYNGVFTSIYFIFSFTYLITRFLLVALLASRIYTTSKLPLETLFSVASEVYCVEIQRFIDHVTNDVVAFTGMKFFYITRGLILTIAGTVVTYELVLVQFNQPPPSVQANITVNDTCTPVTNSPNTGP